MSWKNCINCLSFIICRDTIKHELERNKPLVDRIISDITHQVLAVELQTKIHEVFTTCVAVCGQHGGRSEQTGGGGVHLHTLLRTRRPQDLQRGLQVRVWFRDDGGKLDSRVKWCWLTRSEMYDVSIQVSAHTYTGYLWWWWPLFIHHLMLSLLKVDTGHSHDL